MENASKALIIAGAILIAILLISVAVLIINSTSSTTDRIKTQSDVMSIQAYNSQFLSYLSDNASGREAKSLISLVMSQNAQCSFNKNDCIYMNFSTLKDKNEYIHEYKQNKLQEIYSKINDNDHYKIYISPSCSKFTNGYKDNGYLGCISIRKK